MMKFVDISGFGHSGKGIITDLLREFDGYNVPHYNFEFNLLRIQGGLIDLKFALVDNWSPIRSDAAIRRFTKLINRIGPKATLYSPKTLFYSNGMNYDSYFKGQFSKISKNYISSLISTTYLADWPFHIIDEYPLNQFLNRIKRAINYPASLKEVFLSDPIEFNLKTNKYLNDLFETVLQEGEKVIVLHNTFEPFNPSYGINLFENAKQIIVQRDPRDIYASLSIIKDAYRPEYETDSNWKLKKNMLGNNIDLFIKRQVQYYRNLNTKNDNNKILRLRYEDIILNYNKTLLKIYDFLEETPMVHKRKGEFLKPELSSKNIELWKKFPNQTEISKIKNELGIYCYNEE